MMKLLRAVAPEVLKDTKFHYCDRKLVPLKDADGNTKYTGILFYHEDADGVVTELQISDLINYEASLNTVQNKILCMKKKGVRTSIEGRDPGHVPPFWGGAATFADGSYAGITGGTELQDYLLLLAAAAHSQLIPWEVYDALTALGYPGIRDSIDQFGLTPGGYMSLKASIEAYFRAEVAKLAA